MEKKNKVAALAVASLILALLLVPIPIQVKIVEGKAPCPPPIRKVIKLGLFNLTFHIQNFTVTIENCTVVAETVSFQVKMWKTGNRTEAHVFLIMRNVAGELEGNKFYLGKLYLDMNVEFTEGCEYCYCYAYAKSWVPIIVIIYNGVANCIG